MASADLSPLCLPMSLVPWALEQGKGGEVLGSQSWGFMAGEGREICVCQVSQVENALPKFISGPFCPRWPLCWDMPSLLIPIKSLLKYHDGEARLSIDKICAANSLGQGCHCILSVKPCGPKLSLLIAYATTGMRCSLFPPSVPLFSFSSLFQ